MVFPHPRGTPGPDEVGCFMFFAWPFLLCLAVIQLFFELIGWLFEQTWFYALLVMGIVALVFALIF